MKPISSVRTELQRIQQSLVVPKNNTNSFGGYKYRSCEDILEALKPLLGECTLIISDEVVNIGERYYVVASAKLGYSGEEILVKAYAREAQEKKGMDEAQVTGSASSYARKYALNGLFAIDDTKDADATNDGSTVSPVKPQQAKVERVSQTIKRPEGVQQGDLQCDVCGKKIYQKVYDFSMSKYGKALCFEDQKKA